MQINHAKSDEFALTGISAVVEYSMFAYEYASFTQVGLQKIYSSTTALIWCNYFYRVFFPRGGNVWLRRLQILFHNLHSLFISNAFRMAPLTFGPDIGLQIKFGLGSGLKSLSVYIIICATLPRDEIFHNSFARFLQFPQRNWSFTASPVVNCPNFTVRVTDFFCPQRKEDSFCSACNWDNIDCGINPNLKFSD